MSQRPTHWGRFKKEKMSKEHQETLFASGHCFAMIVVRWKERALWILFSTKLDSVVFTQPRGAWPRSDKKRMDVTWWKTTISNLTLQSSTGIHWSHGPERLKSVNQYLYWHVLNKHMHTDGMEMMLRTFLIIHTFTRTLTGYHCIYNNNELDKTQNT